MARSTAGARRTAGLTEQDIAELSRQLADGKRPRVQLSGPHFPVGAAGTVVRIGSPEADGPDFVRVRVKVNGMTDELAFAPGELSLRRAAGRTAKASSSAANAASATDRGAARPRGARPARTSQAAPTATAPAPTAPAPDRAATTSAAKAAAVPDEPAKAAAARAEPAKAAAARAEPMKAAAARAEPAKAAAARAEPAKAAGRRCKGGTPTVTFTISSTGANWTLTASRGNKSLVRNVALPPGAISAVVELLDQPALTEVVSEINDAALAEARARADQLRAELDKLEAVLATHRRP